MTDNTTGSDNGLQGAFGDRGTNVNAIAYGHPYGEKIIEEARDIISHSEIGLKLLTVMDHHKIPVQMMKGMNESGFSSEMKTIFLQVPKGQKNISGEIVINLLKSLREADLEFSGRTAPNPMTDILAYSSFMHSRNINSMSVACKAVEELTDTEFYTILLDTVDKLGLNSFYKASIDELSDEELYKCYLEAYNS